MTDPRDDPRTPWLLSVVPDEVGRLAGDFQTAARESADTATGLRAAQHDGHWTGRAAEAFRDAIGRLPQQLENLHAGYAAVQSALTAYEETLNDIQPKFRLAYDEYLALQGPLDAALRQDRLDLGTLTSQRGLRGIPRGEIDRLKATVILDGHALARLQNQAEPLREQCQRLLGDFSEARHACRTAIAAAATAAPVRHRSHGGSGTTVVGVVEGGGSAMAGAGRAHAAGRGGHPPAAASPRGRAQEQLHTMLHTAKSLLGVPYVSGGGHGAWTSGGGLDCSGFVSHVLHSGGFLNGPQTTEGFASQPGIAAGHGQFVTIYDRTGCGANEHVIIDLNGHFFEEGGGSTSGGAPFVHRFTPSPEYLASFQTVLHPVGL
jgi:cell wall-associated NlpC family hydrolase/uncharacterized protein YukE